jgi:ADP-ribose diphosphatase
MKYRIIDKKSLHSGFFKLNEYTLSNQLYNGGWSAQYRREVFERGHAAAVLLHDFKRDKVVLVQQFRPGALETESDPWLIELVAGMIEANERPDDVVLREAMEEAGSRILKLNKICEYLTSPGGCTERVWLYHGEVDSSQIASFAGLESENEDIKVHCIPTEQAFEWLEMGKLNNAMTIIAIQWLKLRLLQTV